MRSCASLQYVQIGGIRMSAEKTKTTLNVSITAEDKKFLKLYALKHDVSVAALIEAWIRELRKKEGDEK